MRTPDRGPSAINIHDIGWMRKPQGVDVDMRTFQATQEVEYRGIVSGVIGKAISAVSQFCECLPRDEVVDRVEISYQPVGFMSTTIPERDSWEVEVVTIKMLGDAR